jgi:hypothetical protein
MACEHGEHIAARVNTATEPSKAWAPWRETENAAQVGYAAFHRKGIRSDEWHDVDQGAIWARIFVCFWGNPDIRHWLAPVGSDVVDPKPTLA